MKSCLKINKSGFTLVEVLIAISVFSIAVAGVMEFSAWLVKSVQSESAKSSRNIENIEMLKLLTQPVFFGAQSKYDANKKLKECMNVDTVECSVDDIFTIEPYDLSTDKPIFTASANKDASPVSNKVTFSVHCPNKEPKCDKAEYFSVNVKTYIDVNGLPVAGVDKSGVVVPEFTDVTTFVPDPTVSPGRPINILIFLDTSNSMVFAKDQIKDALTELIGKISNMDAVIGIYNLANAATPLITTYSLDANNNQIAPLKAPPYPVGYTVYTDLKFIPNFFSTYTNQSPASFLKYSSVRVFNFKSSDSLSARDMKKQSILNRIEYDFANSAGYIDSSFCTLIRYFDDTNLNIPFKFDKFTPTALFTISNENDETSFTSGTPGYCNKGFLLTSTATSQTEPLKYAANASVVNLKIEVLANALVDGAPAQPQVGYVNIMSNNFLSFPYQPGGDCLAEAATIPKSIIESKMQFYNNAVKYTSGFTLKSCYYGSTTITLKVSNSPLDTYCNNIPLSDLGIYSKSYVPNSCHIFITGGGPVWAGGSTQKIFFPSGTSSTSGTYNTLKTKLDPKNIFYIPIIHKNTTDCTLTFGASVGSQYIGLSNLIGNNSKAIPICSPSFSSGLDQFKTWTETMGANDLTIPDSMAANFSGIEIIRGSTTIPLAENVDYTRNGTLLIFKIGLLQPNDIIKVYVK